jgi:hypothetical protein
MRSNPVRPCVGVRKRDASRSAKGRKDLREWYPHQPSLWFNEDVTPRLLDSLEI